MGRVWAAHLPTTSFAPAIGVKPQSVSAATVNGTGVDLASKNGVYFTVNVGNVTDPTNATWIAFLQDSADNTTFANVNVTTYPEASTTPAVNTANTTAELAYQGGAGRQRYVRPVVTTANNAALISITGVVY